MSARCCALVSMCLSVCSVLPAQDPVAIKAVPVSGHVHMITGQGGNIGVSVGDDGVFMIDDQFAPLTARIMRVVKKLSDKPVRFVLNTHWHADHTGGNENLGKAGAVIVAHRNTRERMSTEQFIKAFNRRIPPSPKKALPVVTFTESVSFHWNDDELHAFHMPHAHTDGDVIIHFKKANVFHMGDCYFSGRFPFIDTSSGGTLAGVIACADRVLKKSNDKTKIIPGHGPLSNPKELKAWRDMLEQVRARVHALKKDGKSVEEVVAAKPTKDLDAKWNRGRPGDGWVRNIYGAVKGR